MRIGRALTLVAALGLGVAHAAPLADPLATLAPTLSEAISWLGTLEASVADAEALGESVARLQNQWVEAGWADDPKCGPDEAALVAALRVFGPAWREAVATTVAWRAQVAIGVRAPTVEPLLDPATLRRVDAVGRRVELQERRLRRAVAFAQGDLRPRTKACTAAVSPMTGVVRAEVASVGRATRTAVLALSPGGVCGEGDEVPRSGVVLLADGRGCYSEGGCGCVVAPLAPGAVLGPADPSDP